jgi:hypothetical protein
MLLYLSGVMLKNTHVGRTNFGTWGLANSIRRFSETMASQTVMTQEIALDRLLYYPVVYLPHHP